MSDLVPSTVRCAVQNVQIGARRGARGFAGPLTGWRSGVRHTSGQVDPYRREWLASNAANLMAGEGPLLVVLGDSAAQGVGASTPFDGWVGQLWRALDRIDGRGAHGDGPGWRVVNLSVSGARVGDVLDEQLPALHRLDQPVDLVVCAIGGNDMYKTLKALIVERFSRLVRSLPAPGSLAEGQRTILTTLPQGLGRRRAGAANAVISQQAPTRGIEVADLWATTGPPWQDKYADDMFHPNDLGYGFWLQAILATVRPGATVRG